MGRKYSNKRCSMQQSGGVLQQFLVLMVTFFLGYVAASVFDIGTLSHWINTQLVEYSQEKKQPVKEANQQIPISPKPKFEFYTLLANEKTPSSTSQSNPNTTNRVISPPGTPVSENHKVSPTAPVSQSKVFNYPKRALNKVITEAKPFSVSSAQVSRGAYMVQVASFKARQDAEHMKGLLILKGFNVTVVSISHQTKGIWFRVMVGPYSNRTLAQKAQETLARNERIKGMIISTSSNI